MFNLFTLLITLVFFVFTSTFNRLFHNYYVDLIFSLKVQIVVSCLIILLVLMICKREKVPLFSFLVCFSVFFFQFYYREGENNQIPSSQNHIKVAQINVQYTNPYLKENLSELVQDGIDLLVLFEFSDQQTGLFKQVGKNKYTYGEQPIDGFPAGIGIISTFPIIYKSKLVLGRGKSALVEIKLLVNEKIVTVYALHPPSPRSQRFWALRNETLEILQKKLTNADPKEPILIVGDFNTVPWSNYFPKNTNFVTCYDQFGPYTSWSASQLMPLLTLPIDHCMHSKALAIRQFKLNEFPGSDHQLLTYHLDII
ncbi:hypothetical protein PALB_28950 [Pseudoalteromonas luteoviolacea B = ATCC 29581]|nr:hypothetical protein PALB_28950 [Pseudoalteromonas luteoviolacea B = ATCC 29581]